VIEVKEKSRDNSLILESLETSEGRGVADWMTINKDEFKAVVNRLPERSDVAYDIQEHLIVELYSK